MPNPRVMRQMRKARSQSDAKLNITSMMDMFTIILVFLLKSFSTQGQLVTPATGLLLPTSTVERGANPALGVRISASAIAVEDNVVIGAEEFRAIGEQSGFLIPRLHEALARYAAETRRAAEMFGQEFSGDITIHGDVEVPYAVLTRVMYTCGQAGYPNMNLVVYRQE